jgi:DNA-binding LytR/AlgR family response regulator
MSGSAVPFDRVLLHLKGSRRVAIEPDDVYYLEASGDETIIRKHGRRTLHDVRSLAEVMVAFEPFHFCRVHATWAVNLRRIREIRLQRDGRDWAVVLRPPVNRVIPVSRARLRGLLRRFGSSP